MKKILEKYFNRTSQCITEVNFQIKFLKSMNERNENVLQKHTRILAVKQALGQLEVHMTLDKAQPHLVHK